ncbi:LexA family protein [uncultured Allofournierella sp.]|uniref:LexA family protein n=1 Tax=uncultured Allofournierella sp. TaxID=1940258 RepID=UPI003752C922
MGNYLSDRRKELGLTQKEIADMVGVSEGTVSRWESGSIANMRRDRINLYAKALKVRPTFIMTGETEDDMDTDEGQIPHGFSPLPETDRVPRIGRIACGTPITAEENIEDYDSIPSSWRANFTLICVGDSMLPSVQDGDLVAIRKQPTVENGEIAAVLIDDEATLKRVYQYPGKLILQPENPSFEPIVLVGDEINRASIEGKAVGFCRRL